MPFMFFSGNGIVREMPTSRKVGISSKVPIQFLPEAVEGGIPIDGVTRGKLLLEIAKGTDSGDEERPGGCELIIG